jgi:hypothetical protein
MLFSRKTSIGKVALGLAAGALLAVLSALIFPLYFSVFGALIFAVILGILVFSGVVPALIVCLLLAGAVGFTTGPVGFTVTLLIVLPASVILAIAISKKSDIALVFKVGAVAIFVSMALSLLVIHIGNGFDTFRIYSDAIRDTVVNLDVSIRDLVLSVFSQMGLIGAYGTDMDAQAILKLCAQFGDVAVTAVISALPNAMVKLSVYGAVFASLFAIYAAKKANISDEVSAMSDIRRMTMPPRMMNYLVIAYIALWVLSALGLTSLNLVANGVWSLLFAFFALQGASLSLWFLERKHMPRAGGVALVVAGLVLFEWVLFILGLLEQFFQFRLRAQLKDGQNVLSLRYPFKK